MVYNIENPDQNDFRIIAHSPKYIRLATEEGNELLNKLA